WFADDVPPTEFEPFELWAHITDNKVYMPIYENGEFKEWKDTGVSFSEAIENGNNFPEIHGGGAFLFPTGTINFYDLKSEYGEYTEWSSNENEIIGTEYILNNKGFYLTKGESQMIMSADEIANYYRNQKTFEIYRDETYMKKINTEETRTFDLVSKKINVNSKQIYIKYIEGGE
ncbi:MAG TPA: hypothetical protein GX698_00840, partial [Acholeplasmataceae bacterium]|nr:hypothetical protein [Acholeplasmataceae bacterium]